MPKKDATDTLGTELALTDYVAPVVEEPVVALEVVSVTALNLYEVEVVFNQEVDATEGADEANYSLSGGLTVDTATVQADGKTVVINLDGSTDEEFVQQSEYTLTIGSKLVAHEATFSAFDATVPTANSIALTGPNTFEITFSEPLDEDIAGLVEVNSGIYGITSMAADNTNVVEVTLSAASLTAGDYTVTVKDFEDFAGYKVLSTTFTLTYAADTTAPVASVKSAGQTEVVVVFDKAVTDEDGVALDEDYFYHSYSAYKPVVSTTDNKTFTLDFSANPLPTGNVTLYVEADANSKDVEDAWGNKMAADAMFTVEVTADTTKPEITKYEVTDEDKVVLTFSETITTATATDEDNFVVTDADGDAVTAFTAVYNSTDKTVTLDFDADQSGALTIAVSDIKDNALSPNTMTAVTVAVEVADETGIDLAAVTAITIEGGTEDAIILTFPENMDSSVLAKTVYMVSDDAGTTWNALASADATANFNGSDKVKITIADETTYAVDNANFRVLVGRVNDASGNAATLISAVVDPTPDTPPTIESIKIVDYKTVEVKFTGELSTVVAAGFNFTKGGDTDPAAAVSMATASGKTTVTATLKADQQLASDATEADALVALTLDGDVLKSITGKVLADAGPTNAVDNIAPAIDTIAQATTDTILVTMTEDVSITSTALAATDFVLTDKDGDVLVAGVDYVVTDAVADNTELVIDLSGGAYAAYTDKIKVDTVASPLYIFDEDGAALKLTEYGTAKEITIDQAAPVATIPATTGDTTNDVDALVITLDEALYVGGVAVAAGDISGSVTAGVGAPTVTSATYNATDLTITVVLAAVADNDTIILELNTDSMTDAYGNAVAADVTYTYDAAGTIWE
jgi:methionine-rich copper-binding protein CopC